MISRLCFIFCLFLTSGVVAQHHHYLYIQSEPPQAFYLKVGSEVTNSNAGGFLNLPKIHDTAINFVICFPGDLYPAYKFSTVSIKKDKGFSLKNFGEKGWGLFDIQSLEVVMGERSGTDDKKMESFSPPLTHDAFTTILAAVIDDPGLSSTQLVNKDDLMIASAATAVKKTAGKQSDVLSNTQTNTKPPAIEDKKPVANDNGLVIKNDS